MSGLLDYDDQSYSVVRTTTPRSYDDYKEERKKDELVLRVMSTFNLAMIAYMIICAILGSVFGSCAEGPPWWLSWGAVGLAILQGLLQLLAFFRKAREESETLILLAWILFGMVYVLDYNTDGQQLAIAYLCDELRC